MRPRLALSRVMAIVAAVALGLALAVAAAKLQPDAVLTLTGAILVLVAVGVMLRRDWLRVFCLGFAVFGWAYLGVASWSPQARLALPTTRSLVHLGESTFGIAPAVKGPDDIVPMIQWLHDYLRVAHSLVALLSGLVGGLVAVVIDAVARRLAAPAARVPGVGPGGAA